MRSLNRLLASLPVSILVFSATIAVAYLLGLFRLIDIVQRHTRDLEEYRYFYLFGLLALAVLLIANREFAVNHKSFSLILGGVLGHLLGVGTYALCYYSATGLEGLREVVETTGPFDMVILLNTASVMHAGFIFPILMIALFLLGQSLWNRAHRT